MSAGLIYWVLPDGDPAAAIAVLKALPTVAEAVSVDGQVKVTFANPNVDPSILAVALVGGGVKFRGLWEDELGLEEVFPARDARRHAMSGAGAGRALRARRGEQRSARPTTQGGGINFGRARLRSSRDFFPGKSSQGSTESRPTEWVVAEIRGGKSQGVSNVQERLFRWNLAGRAAGTARRGAASL